MLKVVHFEILVLDPKKVGDFYNNVFWWEIKKWEWEGVDMEYWMVMTWPKEAPWIGGGLMMRTKKIESGSPSAFVCTIDVPDIDLYIKKVTDNWWIIDIPKMEIAKVGQMAYCKDPEWNMFWIIETAMGM
jgi:predicted enzyme related to lactoylglutathione lyase